MFGWLWKLWRKRQRHIDITVLWPACLAGADNLEHAKAAFATHAFNDEAWTKDFTHDELVDFIDELD